MKLSMVSHEERPIAHAKQLICEGYGRVWDMDYQKWIVDPRPRAGGYASGGGGGGCPSGLGGVGGPGVAIVAVYW